MKRTPTERQAFQGPVATESDMQDRASELLKKRKRILKDIYLDAEVDIDVLKNLRHQDASLVIEKLEEIQQSCKDTGWLTAENTPPKVKYDTLRRIQNEYKKAAESAAEIINEHYSNGSQGLYPNFYETLPHRRKRNGGHKLGRRPRNSTPEINRRRRRRHRESTPIDAIASSEVTWVIFGTLLAQFTAMSLSNQPGYDLNPLVRVAGVVGAVLAYMGNTSIRHRGLTTAEIQRAPLRTLQLFLSVAAGLLLAIPELPGAMLSSMQSLQHATPSIPEITRTVADNPTQEVTRATLETTQQVVEQGTLQVLVAQFADALPLLLKMLALGGPAMIGGAYAINKTHETVEAVAARVSQSMQAIRDAWRDWNKQVESRSSQTQMRTASRDSNWDDNPEYQAYAHATTPRARQAQAAGRTPRL